MLLLDALQEPVVCTWVFFTLDSLVLVVWFSGSGACIISQVLRVAWGLGGSALTAGLSGFRLWCPGRFGRVFLLLRVTSGGKDFLP